MGLIGVNHFWKTRVVVGMGSNWGPIWGGVRERIGKKYFYWGDIH